MVVFVFLWNDLGMKYDLHEGCEQNLPWCFLRKLLFCVLFFSNFKIWLFLISSNVFWICQHQLPLWVMYSWAHLTCIFFFLFSKKNKTKTKKTFIKTKCFSFFHNYSLRYFDQTKISKKHWKCFEYQSDHSPMWLKQC